MIAQQAIELVVGDIHRDANNVVEDDRWRAWEIINKEIKAAYFIIWCKLKNLLKNDFVKDQDNYPKDCEQVLGMLNHFRPNHVPFCLRVHGDREHEQDKNGMEQLQEEEEDNSKDDNQRALMMQ